MSDLIAAIQAGDARRARQLLEAGVEVDGVDEHGWTALSWAAGRGDSAAASLLLAHGADVFHHGRDARTPYLIALAAGRRDTARLLREAEAAIDADRRGLYPQRPYCRAYPIAELRRFAGWQEPPAAPAASDDDRQGGDDGDLCFVHQDLSVTRSAWHGEQVLFVSTSDAWREFCARSLGFRVPDDLDLLPEPVAG